ncbi:REP-associated tyrosine transposase [Calycomorphotria hydatis]|nr:transposase [Calycomorphotria hydatis]
MTESTQQQDELYAHFVTFSCYKRRRLLDHDHVKQIVLGAVVSQLNKFEAKCIGFVIMPDHVHAIIWFPVTGQLSRFMKVWKQVSSWEGSRFLATSNYAKQINEKEPFWQKGYFPFELYSRSKVEEKLNYMHENPVRAGLMTRGIEWPLSSARYYVLGKDVGVPINWVDCD